MVTEDSVNDITDTIKTFFKYWNESIHSFQKFERQLELFQVMILDQKYKYHSIENQVYRALKK
jgi:hypothetical protein